MMRKRTFIVGNWKMHKTGAEAETFMDALLDEMPAPPCTVYIASPLTALARVAEIAEGSGVSIGAQNVSAFDEGAYTGEVSARMVKETSSLFALIGHSERRRLFAEDDHTVRKKLIRALVADLRPLLCVGETEEERTEHRTEEVLERQLMTALDGVSDADFRKVIIAYEPVWAIGSGRSASPETAQQTHAFCRSVLKKRFGNPAIDTPLLYGGSVNPETVRDLIVQPDIDGALVGGASLDVDAFIAIIHNATSQT
ncbi:MAG: triose-phosphate isomerase [Simkaniaceae bacterium]|nr:triose-phosphate isomerase [Simkaniaceae bacterium]